MQRGASQAEHMEFRITRPDNGEVRWLARRGEYLHDAEIAGSRFSGVIYDITHSKRTEQQLRDLNETLETRVREQTQERDGIWQLSRDLLGIADRQGVWLNINPAWTHALGWNEDEIVGRNSQWLEHPDDAGSGPRKSMTSSGQGPSRASAAVCVRDRASTVGWLGRRFLKKVFSIASPGTSPNSWIEKKTLRARRSS